jgi:hypothetical protein
MPKPFSDAKHLTDLAGPDPWMIFNKLDLSLNNCDFLLTPIQEWAGSQSYLKFKSFANSLSSDNDSCERNINLVQDYVLKAKTKKNYKILSFQLIKIENFLNMIK